MAEIVPLRSGARFPAPVRALSNDSQYLVNSLGKLIHSLGELVEALQSGDWLSLNDDTRPPAETG